MHRKGIKKFFHHCHEGDARRRVLDFHALQCLLLGQREKEQAGAEGRAARERWSTCSPGAALLFREPQGIPDHADGPSSLWASPALAGNVGNLRISLCLGHLSPVVSSALGVCGVAVQHLNFGSLCALAEYFWCVGEHHKKWRWKWQKEIFIFENCGFHIKCQGSVLYSIFFHI